VHEERGRHDVPEKSEAGQDRAERPPLRRDVDELDLEQIARGSWRSIVTCFMSASSSM
jgi:hypothetical protein